ncbi:synaptosomal-associated protein 29-like [Oppia nitens]|uniref:synaptosomal-associated protein 29-like n=1 Tax=Oppia nitens TaxID=1686743 RepID=UPI0023DB07C9|nr:synaptosomal-associated protein 29-like [Oppia nitens]
MSFSEWKDKRRELFEEKLKTEENSLESCKQTLSLILESERIGIKTGRELVRQRETLNKVEDKLVSIDADLNQSQKHLKSMKSFFSGFKSVFSSKKSNNKSETIVSYKSDLFEAKSCIESKSIDVTDVTDGIPNDNISDDNNYNENEWTFVDIQNKSETIKYWHKSNEMNDKIEENLNEIDFGLQRLKELSLDLGNELDVQNQLIDRITKQTERTELRIQQQSQQMRKILKK